MYRDICEMEKESNYVFCSKVPSASEGYRPTGPRYRSVVWKHFRITYNDITKVSCDYCDSKITYIGGSTATMLKHVRNIHPRELSAEREKQYANLSQRGGS